MMDAGSIDLESHLDLNDPDLTGLYADALQAQANEVPPGTDVDKYLRYLLRNSRLLTIRAGAVQRLVDALTLRASGAYVAQITASVEEVEAPAPPPNLDAATLRRDKPQTVANRVRASRRAGPTASGNDSTQIAGGGTIGETGQERPV